MGNSADWDSKQQDVRHDSVRHDRERQEHGGGRKAADEHGHSGEGAASALAHMIKEDQKHRRQNGNAEEKATLA